MHLNVDYYNVDVITNSPVDPALPENERKIISKLLTFGSCQSASVIRYE